MPTFDIVSEVDEHELSNAIDQANREITNRFDFNGTNAKFVLNDSTVTLTAPSDFQVKQMEDILQNKIVKRGLDTRCLDASEISVNLSEAKQDITVRQGIDKDIAKKIVKLVKDTKIKVQTQIQGEQIRVTGKKRDDLQGVMAYLRDQKVDVPLQFTNFRD